MNHRCSYSAIVVRPQISRLDYANTTGLHCYFLPCNFVIYCTNFEDCIQPRLLRRGYGPQYESMNNSEHTVCQGKFLLRDIWEIYQEQDSVTDTNS